MKEISIKEFLKINTKDLQIIDVRERYEYESGNIDAIHIPMDQILYSINKIDLNKQVIIYCQTGRRAASVIYMLNKKCNLNNIFNLTGGYEAYLNLKEKRD